MQEMARLNINILKISELKWIRMGGFNSDDHLIQMTTVGKKPLEDRKWFSQSTKESEMQYSSEVSKMTE